MARELWTNKEFEKYEFEIWKLHLWLSNDKLIFKCDCDLGVNLIHVERSNW